MITISLESHTQRTIQLGQVCEFALTRSSPEIQTRAFVIHQNIRYLKPLTEWNTNDRIQFFPEAPGEFALAVQWRSMENASHWVHFPFRVITNAKVRLGPAKAEIDKNTRLWGISQWEANRLRGYEQPVFDLLGKIVQPGQVVYDIGASLGQYSIWFSRAVGHWGRVYCFEANPVCVYLLQANLELNQAVNCEILPVALSSGTRAIEFTINYANSALGVTRDSSFYAPKMGHEITVLGFSLDELVGTFEFRKPDILKIDIEGAEEQAIAGMQKSLSRHRPMLLLEVHGQEAARATFRKLDNLGYCFLDVVSGKKFEDLNTLLEWFPEAVRQFLCTPIV